MLEKNDELGFCGEWPGEDEETVAVVQNLKTGERSDGRWNGPRELITFHIADTNRESQPFLWVPCAFRHGDNPNKRKPIFATQIEK